MLRKGDVEVQPTRIIQEISASVPECKSARSNKNGWIAEERPKTLRIIARRRQPATDIGIRSCNSEAARNTGIVGKRDSRIPSTVNDRERCARLIDRHSGKFPTAQKPVGKPQACARVECRLSMSAGR